MQLKYLIIVSVFIATSCNQQKTAPSETAENGKPVAGEEAKQSGNWEKLVWNAYRDQKGTVIAEIPFPPSWKVAQNPAKGTPGITGPNGIVITDYQAQSYLYTNDPQLQQVYYQSGQKLRAMPSIEEFIKQDIEPWGANKGLQFVRYYEVPEVAKVDKWYNDQLFKVVPTETQITAIGTDWKSADGTPYFLLVHLNGSEGGNIQSWYYYSIGLEAEASHFEAARKQLIFSLSNTYYHIEPIMAYNQQEAEKAGKSWAAFNQRMAQNQAAFEANQRAFVNKSNAINDAIMNGWKERNAASDKSHEQFVDVITERTNVTDPTTGQKYKVASGHNQYWMNTNGEYISSDKHNYDPNLDDNMNNQKWNELKEVK